MNRTLLPVVAVAVLAMIPVSATATATESDHAAPTVSQAWARATPPKIKIGAAYVKIEGGHHGDRLVGASSKIADRVEIHAHAMDGGKMSMTKIDDLDIPAGGTVKFEPGGYHLMLIDLRQQLKEGEQLKLVLEFANAGKVDVVARIVPAWSLGPDGKKGEDHSQHHSEHHGGHGSDHKNHDHSKHMEHHQEHQEHERHHKH